MKIIRYITLSSILLLYTFAFHLTPEEPSIFTNYGVITDAEQVIHDLIQHPMMQRLKKIHQYGVSFYLFNDYDYDRFEHSIGVYALLKRFKAPLNEQITGLLHDASHTVFSHGAEHFFKRRLDGDSYQDEMHEWFLSKVHFDEVLSKHGLMIKEILHKNKKYTCLEQELPNICADRLEYILRGGVLEQKLTPPEVEEILTGLRFKNDTWYFVDRELAKKFAFVSLYLTEFLFASEENVVANELLSDMLHRAVDIALLTLDDIHFGCDNEIWQKLTQTDDEIITTFLNKLHNISQSFSIGTEEHFTHFFKCKFRGVDPFIKTDNGLQRLTQLDDEYNKMFSALKEKVNKGLCLLIK